MLGLYVYDLQQYGQLNNSCSLCFLFLFCFDWLVGCFGLNGPLRQRFSLYRAVPKRDGERREKRQIREKMSKQPPPAPTASAVGPCTVLYRLAAVKGLPIHHHSADYILSGPLGSLGSF